MSEIFLFIGGCQDGQLNPSFGQNTVRFPVPSTEACTAFKVETYRREKIATQKRMFEFFVWDGLSTESAIELLLNHYIK